MPLLLPGGQTFDQKVVTTTNDDTAINTSIQAEQLNAWVVQYIIPSGSNVIILYSQTIVPGLS